MVQMLEVSCKSLGLGGKQTASEDFALVVVAWPKGRVEVAVSSVVVVEEGAHASAGVAVGEYLVLADVEHELVHQENPGKSV